MTNIIPLSSFEKRIANEFNLLYTRYGNVSIYLDNKNVSVVSINHDGNNYSIMLNSLYPFRPPERIAINKTPIKQIYKLHGAIFSDYLLEYYGADCIICSSFIFNNSKWTPRYKIIDIIDEILNIFLINKKILMRILCDKIRNKYGCLMEFARFEDYLFSHTPCLPPSVN
jgi:ubiquitin-protein ligase